MGRRGPATDPAGRPPRARSPPPAAHLGTQLDELRSTSQVAYRFICTGAGVRPGPGPPGVAEPEATATAMEVEVDEDEEEAAAAEVDEDDEVAWASLGGVGCCGSCCGGGCCGGDWATPEPRWPLPPPAPPGPPPAPPRSAMARPGIGRHRGYGNQATPSGRRGFSGGGGGGGSTRLLRPPARARERETARTRGASRRAVLALARRCQLRLAPPKHWVGVSGEGAGRPGRRPPHPAPRGGAGAALAPAPRAGLWACAPLALQERGRRFASRPDPLLKFAARRQPADPPLLSRRPFHGGGGSRASGNLAFPGRGPGPEGATAGARLGPLGSVDQRPNPLPTQARFPTAALAPTLRLRGFFAVTTSEGSDGDPAAGWAPVGRAVSAPLFPSVGKGSRT